MREGFRLVLEAGTAQSYLQSANGLSPPFSPGSFSAVIAVSEFEKDDWQDKENYCRQKVLIMFPQHFRDVSPSAEGKSKCGTLKNPVKAPHGFLPGGRPSRLFRGIVTKPQYPSKRWHVSIVVPEEGSATVVQAGCVSGQIRGRPPNFYRRKTYLAIEPNRCA